MLSCLRFVGGFPITIPGVVEPGDTGVPSSFLGDWIMQIFIGPDPDWIVPFERKMPGIAMVGRICVTGILGSVIAGRICVKDDATFWGTMMRRIIPGCDGCCTNLVIVGIDTVRCTTIGWCG